MQCKKNAGSRPRPLLIKFIKSKKKINAFDRFTQLQFYSSVLENCFFFTFQYIYFFKQPGLLKHVRFDSNVYGYFKKYIITRDKSTA